MLKSIQHKDITWIDIQAPTKEDIRYLEENFQFHELVLEELIPPGHRPKVEHGDGYLFLILYYPTWNKEQKSIFPRELDILVTKNHIITSHYHTISPVAALFSQINLDEEMRKELMSRTTGHILFTIIQKVLQNALRKLEHIEKKVGGIEKQIFQGHEERMVFEISMAQRAIIDFRRILVPETSIIESLVLEGPNFFGKELEPHFADLRGTFGLVWNELENYRETVQALTRTNESLLTTKTNTTIKVLTAFSVIFLPVSIIVNVWGMNFSDLPLSAQRYGFWIVMGFSIFVAVVMIGYFRKRKWL